MKYKDLKIDENLFITDNTAAGSHALLNTLTGIESVSFAEKKKDEK